MTDQTAQHPAAPETDASALTDREAHALADAARSTGLSVSGLQLDAIEAEVDRILRERLRVVEGERREVRIGATCPNGSTGACDSIRCGSTCSNDYDRMHPCMACVLGELRATTVRAESAEAVIAKVERIVSDAEERDRQSLSRTFSGGTFGAYIPATDLRALLPGDGR